MSSLSLSAEARDRIESLLAESARTDGAAAQELLGGVRCVLVKSIVGQGDGCEVCDDMPACCDECGADFTYANGAVCLNCFEKAHT